MSSLKLSFRTPIIYHFKNQTTIESNTTAAAMNSFADSEDSFSFAEDRNFDSDDEDWTPEIPNEDNIISFPMFLTNIES